ncbi:MAG TPA: trypsin-like peptidase domain-containing protein, partial [Beijerinckiaceae bacterium]|nr:trypsin-like peptidase domain-containing protein [Beijerinckiaceae bacterium]
QSAPAPGLSDGNGAPRMELTPRPPEQAPLPKDDKSAGGAKNVAELLDKSTVMVFGLTKDGYSQGTGFFISDRRIVTNHHVIAPADPDYVFVASPLFGGVRHAHVVARTMPPPSETDFRPDFAVLEISRRQRQRR